MKTYVMVGMAEERRVWWAPWRKTLKSVVWMAHPVADDVPLTVSADLVFHGPMMRVETFTIRKREAVPA